ncbi:MULTISPECIES: thiolase family protein [unclassified Rhodococcus (in: high G+C Gram-positive bacteria)]|uniref:thiolase family protein n=1 Tax=unclassified Rhodococcus (in: high G+C Gram-positive bacteria) TaxID=192944 RepID=UPI00163A1DE6|nr:MULTISPECIES: thiolase family protein [unclassified Rhodococcus (in: high G+C Gram-positive bacteria)]MBC2640252.1 thiolase family protein [Rhodococcus sp. 3A]MBC2895002.1 thiolase family protein [Rhodococcus sp. 4CII]
MSSGDIWIIGASMTPFGRHDDKDLIDLAAESALDALGDADVTINDIDILTMGNVYEANSHNGQRLQKQIGQTGIPVYNVVNACATGATALRVALLSIKAGESDIGLAVGVEKMGKGGLIGGAAKKRDARKVYNPSGRYGSVLKTEGILGTGIMPGVFAQAGTEYALAHGVTATHFAKVAQKNHAHSVLNPLAHYRKEFSLDDILNADVIAFPNTLPMCCPNTDGAASVVVVSDAKLKTMDPDVRRRAVKISASVLTSDPWVEGGQVQPDVSTLTRNAAAAAYEQAGVGPEDLDLVELHDCFATAELIHYDNLGLCEPGGAGDFLDSGAPWRDGKTPVNVSGGLLSKGHPLGATGIANIYEVATHLRGEAGERQIAGAKIGLTHVIGLASACAVHILEAGVS